MRYVKVFVISLSVVVAGVGVFLGCDYRARRRAYHERTACVGALIRMRMCKEVYAEDHGLTNGATISEDVVWKQNGGIERCLSGGRYSINPVGAYPSCSYTGVVQWHQKLWSHKWGPPE